MSGHCVTVVIGVHKSTKHIRLPAARLRTAWQHTGRVVADTCADAATFALIRPAAVGYRHDRSARPPIPQGVRRSRAATLGYNLENEGIRTFAAGHATSAADHAISKDKASKLADQPIALL
jgi:hypothetical protein